MHLLTQGCTAQISRRAKKNFTGTFKGHNWYNFTYPKGVSVNHISGSCKILALRAKLKAYAGQLGPRAVCCACLNLTQRNLPITLPLIFPRLVKPSPVKKSKLSDEITKPTSESLAQKLSSKAKKEEEKVKKNDGETKREEKSIKAETKKLDDIKKEDERSPKKKKADEKKEKSRDIVTLPKSSPIKIKVEEKVEVKKAVAVAKASPKKVESSQSSQSQSSSEVSWTLCQHMPQQL